MARDQSTTTPAPSRRHTAPTTKTQLNTMVNLRYAALHLGDVPHDVHLHDVGLARSQNLLGTASSVHVAVVPGLIGAVRRVRPVLQLDLCGVLRCDTAQRHREPPIG